MSNQKQELSYGERAVGIEFNPANSDAVFKMKTAYATIINDLYERRERSEDQEQKRLLSVAITEAQGAQMWAVKGITWTFNK